MCFIEKVKTNIASDFKQCLNLRLLNNYFKGDFLSNAGLRKFTELKIDELECVLNVLRLDKMPNLERLPNPVRPFLISEKVRFSMRVDIVNSFLETYIQFDFRSKKGATCT